MRPTYKIKNSLCSVEAKHFGILPKDLQELKKNKLTKEEETFLILKLGIPSGFCEIVDINDPK